MLSVASRAAQLTERCSLHASVTDDVTDDVTVLPADRLKDGNCQRFMTQLSAECPLFGRQPE